MKYVVALDQGTTSSRAIVFDEGQEIIAVAQKEFSQIYPHPGYVEHDPMEIYSSQYGVLVEAVTKSGVAPEEFAAIGIANQRETTIMWDKATGKPVYNAIVWQCRRTSHYCEDLKKRGLEAYIKKTTGLVIDAYFSATKIMWILDNVPGARKRADAGEILFGTVDTWLVWNLSGGRAHVTDCTNASRTMLFDIHAQQWDEKLLNELNIPRSILPEVRSSSEMCAIANVLGKDIPISGLAGDQQAALFGQACFAEGDAKNTYGTGCFLLMNTGDRPINSRSGLITTIAISRGGKVQYALEGSVFSAGSVIKWLRDELNMIKTAEESEKCAQSVKDSAGVYIVPAFSGLGAPWWDMQARGAMFGITDGANKNHIIRAALESIAFQTKDVLDAMQADIGFDIMTLKADGGASANNFLMQFQADILNRDVMRAETTEATALGAARLAGLAVGMWEDIEELCDLRCKDRLFKPSMGTQQRGNLLNGWKSAVGRSLGWT
ncbi:MAG: glycerol kinase GlpK [Oscillospiraceae bacterium]|nr:glycerol kinase GlpK [Oscillospiraceae bacterium]